MTAEAFVRRRPYRRVVAAFRKIAHERRCLTMINPLIKSGMLRDWHTGWINLTKAEMTLIPRVRDHLKKT